MMRALILKEYRQGWRSFRIPAFFFVLLFFALLDPPTTKYMGEIMQWFADDFQIIFPEPTAVQAFTSFLSSVSQIGYWALIFISMGVVANEKQTGVAAWILTQPITRRDYVLAKFFVLSSAVIIGVIGSGLIAYLYCWSLLGSFPFLPALYSLFALSLYGMFLLSICFLGSILLRSSWGAGILTIAVMAGSSLLHLLSSRLEVLLYLPYGFVVFAQEAFTGIDGSQFLVRVLVTVVLVGALSMLSVAQFSKQELG